MVSPGTGSRQLDQLTTEPAELAEVDDELELDARPLLLEVALDDEDVATQQSLGAPELETTAAVTSDAARLLSRQLQLP